MKLVPRLRFPEFRNTEGWEPMQIGKLLKFQTGFPFDSGGFNEEGIGVRLIRNRDLKSDDKIIYYSKDYDERFLVYDGDILVGMDGDFTPCTWNKGKALLNQRVGRVLANESNSQRFFYYLLSIQLKAVEEATARTTVKHLSHSDVEKIKAYIPASSEQQKIADCLSSLDELVAAECAKLEALKAHKKGLMQQLFLAEGKMVPALRFAGFEGDWEEKKLGDVSKISSGGTPNRANANYWNGSIPWVTTSLVDFNIIREANEFISEDGLENSSAKIFPKNTILMAMYGQGKTRGKVAILGIETTTNQACAALLFDKKVDTNFAFQNLASRYDEIRESSNQGGQENLSAGLIASIPFSFPDIEEQQKIADCLSSLDALMTAQNEKIETLKLHKKALMQQLFPTPTAE